ncbi:hypothetical protein [Aneurinibacillus migulanus]|uniref:hypothetical protein n=2 Tax=Aneurinibacillus migulanus TaxID=47500 RepID=UPI0005BC579C|nr:hypothetical protein [Aneurinibacillus migulanus]KIV58951.1 hypothetical protein TS64_04100 [Aneurinibacillus migulanus]
MKFLKALLCSLLVFSVLGGGSASAAPIEKTLVVDQHYKMEFNEGSGSNTYWRSYQELPMPKNVLFSITKINGTVTPLKQATSYGVNYGDYISFGGNWVESVSDVMNKKLTPNSSDGYGARFLMLWASADKKYDEYGVDVHVKTIEYIEYPIQVDLTITPEKYVRINVHEKDRAYLPNLRIQAVAVSDGNRKLESWGSTIEDTLVQIGKTYRYEIYGVLTNPGKSVPLEYLGTYSVLVPSPMDETKQIAEQARDAAREASQNASIPTESVKICC